MDPTMAKAIAAGARAYLAAAPKVKPGIPSSDLLLFHRILPLFDEAALQRTEQKAGPPFRYPDGSLHFVIRDRAVYASIADDLLLDLVAEESIQDTHFRNLAPLPPASYVLYYGGTYHRLIGEDRYSAGTGIAPKNWPGDYLLDDLQVTVWFRTPPDESVRDRFARRVGDWLRSMSPAGIFGEGPVTTVRPEIEFRGKRASLHFDVSRTGPHTVIWFVLSMLDFGHAVLPVSGTVFNEDDPLAVKTTIECARNAARHTDSEFTEADEKKWLEDRVGGPGPSILLPLSC